MRDNLARQITAVTQEIAVVVSVSGPSLRVRSSLGEATARRAASCLLEPALGDEVLVAHHERGSHVLAVLERDAATPARLSADGDLEITAPSGRVSVSGREGIDLLTPGESVIATRTLRISAQEADATVGALAYLGDRITAKVDQIKSVAKTVESTAERWVQRLDRAYRFIQRSEVVRAEYLEYEARAAFHVKAEATLVNSSGLTKIDGSQIHLG